MLKVKLHTKYKFLESELVTVKKMTGANSEQEVERYLDSLDEDKRNTLLSTMLFFIGNNDAIRNKIFSNSSGI